MMILNNNKYNNKMKNFREMYKNNKINKLQNNKYKNKIKIIYVLKI